MDKLKLDEWRERLKTSGAQMGRILSGKMKEFLQTPSLEAKMVDEATLETLETPNWGMNMRICAMINSEEFNGTEVVKAIKKKISGESMVSQRLSLDLLEACTTNCNKVSSEVAAEKVLDEMVRMINNPQTDQGNRDKASQLIRAWGQSEDLAYLPVFRQTYMSLKEINETSLREEGNSRPMQYTLESYVHQQPISAPETYPTLDREMLGADSNIFAFNFGNLSIEEKKDFIVMTRNSFELLSSMLNTEAKSKFLKDDLTVSMLLKCKQSQPVIQMLIESTTDDESMLFEALSLHDELQRVISKYNEMEAGKKSVELPENSDANDANTNFLVRNMNESENNTPNGDRQ